MLYRNDIFSLNEQRYRVLALEPNTDLAWLINLDKVNPLPESRSLSALLSYEAKGVLQVAPLDIEISELRASVGALNRSQVAWERIEPLVSDEAIFYPELRCELVKNQAKMLKCSIQTIYKNLRQYWTGGQTKAALLGKFHNCGKSDKRSEKRRGRKPSILNYTVFAVKNEDIANIEAACRKYYFKSEATTAAATYQRLLEEHYSYHDGNGKRIINPVGEKPTRRQFYYALEKLFSLEEKIRKRKGDKDFERDHRSTLGSMQLDCNGIGHIYEIDATVADFFLVSLRDRSRIIGKPTLYLIYDRRSRLVVGFYIGLEAASWPAAMQAILSIFENKAELCRKYGIEYDPADWPAHGLMPEKFLADRGEMLSNNSNNLCTGLEVTVMNAPALRPDRKGTVECGFKQIQSSMADAIPGYEPPDNVFKRRGKHYENDACLNLHEFTAIVLRNIIMHNRLQMDAYQLSIEAISNNIRPIPREIWAYEAPTRAGSLSRYSENFVRFSLLPKDKATVTTDGIYFKGCYYSCAEAVQNGWFIRAGRGRFDVGISYDRRLVDDIYIHDKSDRTHFIKATLLEKSAIKVKGMSFAEVESLQYLESAVIHNGAQIRQQEFSDFHAFTDPITKKAHSEMRKSSKKKSRSARKADTKYDRTQEMRLQRQIEAALPSQHDSAMPPGHTATVLSLPISSPRTENDSESLNLTELTLAEKLRRKRMEMMKND